MRKWIYLVLLGIPAAVMMLTCFAAMVTFIWSGHNPVGDLLMKIAGTSVVLLCVNASAIGAYDWCKDNFHWFEDKK